MRLAHFGTFDVENYGDLLFPLLLEHRLSDLCDEFVHVSPTDVRPPWSDCAEPVSFESFMREAPEVDAVVVGGGQIIRSRPTALAAYDRGGISSALAYPSLWLGAAHFAAQRGVPLCWNAPGAPAPFASAAADLVRWTASTAGYLSVRDESSRRFLEEAGVAREINLVPDTAVETPDLWSDEELSEAYGEAFVVRGRKPPFRTIVFHVNSRWVGEDPASVAARIDRICARQGATAILLAFGPVHGDDEVQRRVAQEMTTQPLPIERPRSLLEATACLARSEAYFGSSLHGMIVAGSFGRRGVLVASRKDDKYAGFLDHYGLSSWLAESWEEAEERAGELFSASGDPWERVPEAGRPVLDQHWKDLREALTNRGKEPAESGRSLDDHVSKERLQWTTGDQDGDSKVFEALTVAALQEAGALLYERTSELEAANQKLREERRKIGDLVRWLEALDENVAALLGSRQWRAGQTLGEIQRRASRKPKRPAAPENLVRILEQYRAWRTEARKQGEDAESPGDEKK